MGAFLLETRKSLLTAALFTGSIAAVAAVPACSNGSSDAPREGTATSSHGLTASTATPRTPRTRLVAWGDGPLALGLRPAVTERAAFGVPALAVGPTGELFVLDAVHQRVVRLGVDTFASVASVPLDADDLAVASDGALAVHRQMSPRVLVLSPTGDRLGEVDASPAGDIDSLVLAPSRRVIARSADQETFQLGSPSFPQRAGAVLGSRRVGAGLLPDGNGIATVVKDGVAELRVIEQAKGEGGHAETRAAFPLGAASSAHLVGLSGAVACMRLEHVSQAAPNGPLDVEREALCVDTSTGATVLREPLAPVGLYVPRRELTFDRGVLAFAHPEPEGLRITTWAVGREGGAK